MENDHVLSSLGGCQSGFGFSSSSSSLEIRTGLRIVRYKSVKMQNLLRIQKFPHITNCSMKFDSTVLWNKKLIQNFANIIIMTHKACFRIVCSFTFLCDPLFNDFKGQICLHCGILAAMLNVNSKRIHKLLLKFGLLMMWVNFKF